MNWMLWLAVAFLLFEAIATPIRVGKPRKPLTAGEATGNLMFWLGLIVLVIAGGVHS